MASTEHDSTKREVERFFISGCQRSGTTMLRLILESHPSIQCFDEEVGYDMLVSESGGSISEYVVKDNVSLVGFKIPRFAEQLTWTEFNDPDYGAFPSFYDNQKVIHVFRDVLDVVGSMMKLKMSDGVSWLDLYGQSILNNQIDNKNISDLFRKKYKKLESQGLPLHLVGALYWEIKNQGYFDLLQKGMPVYAVKYENLVVSPKNELQEICNFMEVRWVDAMLNHHKCSHGELDKSGIAIGGTDSHRPIDTRSIGGFQSLMTDEQIQDVRCYTEDSVNKINKVFA